MITAIEIENFKAIGKRQRIELKPITLLFGPNSAGKSTIIQALHYAREILERHNLNADTTVSGGEYIDLGGFRSFVHDRDLNREVWLKFDMAVTSEDFLPDLGGRGDSDRWTGWALIDRLDYVKRLSVGLNVGWDPYASQPYVREVHTDADGELTCVATASPGKRPTLRVNGPNGDPISVDESSSVESIGSLTAYWKAILCETYGDPEDPAGLMEDYTWPLYSADDALPNMDLPLDLGKNPLVAGEQGEPIPAILTKLFIGPLSFLRTELRQLRYLGPLRETPPRNYSLPRYPDPSRWSNGLAAWDVLTRRASEGDFGFMNEVSSYLQGDERSGPGYQLNIRRIKELDMGSSLFQLIQTGRAFDEIDDLKTELDKLPTQNRLVLLQEGDLQQVLPADVGVGISQFLPVVVAVLDDHYKLLGAEQPELHIHPALQVRLGDLFIKRVSGAKDSHRLLIETHSEHLVLRLLRRIRETSQGTVPSGLSLRPEQLAVLYVEPGSDGATVTQLRVTPDGDFQDNWPRGFFEEREEELF